MPDPTDPLPPEEDARIRSLLADAGALSPDERLPDDVARRLDDRLAALVAERSAEDATSPATTAATSTATSAAGGRTSRGRLLLVAAATVAIVGIGVPVIRSLGPGTVAGTSADSGSAGGVAKSQGDAAAPEASSASRSALAALPALTTADFPAGVRRALASSDDRAGDPSDPPYGLRAPDRLCSGGYRAAPAGVRRTVPVTLDGSLALLRVHAPRDGARLVQAVTCDGTLLATTTLR